MTGRDEEKERVVVIVRVKNLLGPLNQVKLCLLILTAVAAAAAAASDKLQLRHAEMRRVVRGKLPCNTRLRPSQSAS